MTDPIADMFTRIRNALMAKHDKVKIPLSKIKTEIATILKSEGYIRNFKLIKNRNNGLISIYLKYDEDNCSVIHGIKRGSKPGNRLYVGRDEIPQVLNGLGIGLISTSQGILTDRACRKAGIGGEALGYIW